MLRVSAQALALANLVLLLGATLVEAPWPREQGLQQIGTAAGVALYLVAWRRWNVASTALLLFAEIVAKELALARRAALAVAVTIVIATSALYELGEWLVAIVAAPERADRYLGQQGDAWDAQKDMALATAGACITAVALALRRGR